MNTLLSLSIIHADYAGEFEEDAIEYGEQPSVDYQQIHVAELSYEPYAPAVARMRYLSTTKPGVLQREYFQKPIDQDLLRLIQVERQNELRQKKRDKTRRMRRTEASRDSLRQLQIAWNFRWQTHDLIDRFIACAPTRNKADAR